MTEGGKRLFKIAGMGLGGVIGFMLIIRMISSFTGGGGPSERELVPGGDPFAQIKQWVKQDGEKKEEVLYSAKGRLMNLLHSHAFNHYRSKRFKDAIRLWEIAGYLGPEDVRVQIRLNEAKESLRALIELNAAIANKDYLALRFERAIEFYQRAANYAADFDEERYRDLQKLISMAERKMAR